MPALPPRLALTPGEPAGVGPELAMRVAAEARSLGCQLVLVADPGLCSRYGPKLPQFSAEEDWISPGARILPVNLKAGVQPGQLDPANVPSVLESLQTATDACLEGTFEALVTGPVHKAVINLAGTPFTGHTEWLAEHTGAGQVVMLLAAGQLRVALATTHLPLRAVPDSITRQHLVQILQILHEHLQIWFDCKRPRISVAGLNPHAGEGGHLGHEDMEVIAPAVAEAAEKGMQVQGPLPADTLFTPRHLAECDAVLAMYHDQGLPVLKAMSFGAAVNITLGLPIIRTSVDHGTALDLAGSGRAEHQSLAAAVIAARDMVLAARRQH